MRVVADSVAVRHYRPVQHECIHGRRHLPFSRTPQSLQVMLLFFFTPVLDSQGIKKSTQCNTKKYKNQAGMNLTLPASSQNSHAVGMWGWHCTSQSERRVAEIISRFLCLRVEMRRMSLIALHVSRTSFECK